MQHVVNFSGGVGSWCAAKRVAIEHGTENLVLLFADTLIEDADLYRFLEEGAANIGGKLVKIADGRTPWQVFKDVRYLGNSRVDPCSRVLKRALLDKWREENCDPADTVVYCGIDWSEMHRFVKLRERLEGWTVRAPMCDRPYISKAQQLDLLAAEGIRRPRLYDLGFPHNNCGGACVKAGLAHFRHLLKVLPDVYAEWERNELELQEYLGRFDATILRDRRGGKTTPMTLRDFRLRIEAENESQAELFDEEWGGCGCAVT